MLEPSILVVEDEEDIRELVEYNLRKEGYRPIGVASGEEALAAARAGSYELILLDLMLPGVDGLTVCRTLKADPDTSRTPVIMLTAKGEEGDIVSGLNLGADDYVTKPFSPRVLLARVKAVIRRGHAAGGSVRDERPGEPIRIHELVIDPKRHEVLVETEPCELTSTEFKLLTFLADKPGWVFTRGQIIDGIHGDNYPITERAVDVQVVGLRKKLGKAGRYIETVRGVGYRFKE
jgi:two-component system phosphate regulon response regulator PhoB